MVQIQIHPQGTLAIYEQIVNQLKNAIVTNELKAQEALPSIRSWAAELGVSVITTKRAYEELEKEEFPDIAGAPCTKKSKQLLNGIGCSWYALNNINPDDESKKYWNSLPW